MQTSRDLPHSEEVGAAPMSVDAGSESDRLASLYRYAVLDTPAEKTYDRLVRLAAEICDTPMALVTLIDSDRQWVKARLGLDVIETSREISFCQYTIAGRSDVMIVPDASLDDRFSGSPLVTGAPFVRFYAGVVLRDREGRGLGALCVLDQTPRHLSGQQLDSLVTVANQVTALLELRRETASLSHTSTALEVSIGGAIRRAVISLDPDFRIVGWSADAERVFGYSADMVAGRPMSDILQADMTAETRGSARSLLRVIGWWDGDVTYYRRDGEAVRVRARIDSRHDTAGARIGYICRTEDITSSDVGRLCSDTYANIVTRMANGEALASLATSLCQAVETALVDSRVTLMAVDDDTGQLSMVAAPSLSHGFSEVFTNVPIGSAVGACGSAAYLVHSVISANISTDPVWAGWRHAPEAEGLVSCWSHPVVGPDGCLLGALSMYWDRPHEPGREERQLVTTLAALAVIVLTARQGQFSGVHPDSLTGLLSRDGLDRGFARLDPEVAITILAIGLDRFGLVNMQYGLEVGDGALQEVGERIRSVGDASTLRARFGGDQFVIVLQAADGSGQVAADLVEDLGRPVVIGGNELWLSASIGVGHGVGGDGQAILHDALAAKGRAHRLGGNQVLDHNLAPVELASASLDLVGALHRAVSANSLVVHYQPKVTIASGAVEGFEALVRWTRPDGTSVPPSQFIPIAEEIGLIATIGENVLRQACRDAVIWATYSSGSHPGVAVNISARQLVPNLAETVASALRDSGLPASKLSLEVTETALATDFEVAIGALRDLKSLGVRIAIDDFGVGYSSLGYLSRFPIDELKIDRAFVERIGHDKRAEAIVGSVIGLSHTLGLRCVAEGVERPEELELLARLGCDAYQGYLYSPAVPMSEVALLLA